MISALTGQAPLKSTAMTGEITLHGKVLPIGGLKEKVLAAQREGIELLVLPEKNKATFENLPINVKKKIKATFVRNYSEVFEIMFESIATNKVNESVPVRPVVVADPENLAS
jgi:ATP-dependent Lon protease